MVCLKLAYVAAPVSRGQADIYPYHSISGLLSTLLTPVYIFLTQERQPTRASKYASLFFMTGADPAEANQAAALRALREFVHLRRCGCTSQVSLQV